MSIGAVSSSLRTLVAVAALALLASACGPDDTVADDPGGALRTAVEALADYEGFELVLSLEADDTAMSALVADGELTQDEAELVFGSSITVRTSGEGEDGAVELVATVEGNDVVELRVLPRTDIYARADLATILELADDPDAAATLADFVAQAEMFGFGDLAAAVQAGDWIRLTGVEQMLAMFDAMDPDGADELDEEEAERLAEEIAAAAQRFIGDDVEVTYVGSEDAGERVRATVDGAALQRFASEVLAIIASADALGELADDQLLRDLERDVPDDVTLTFDAWIADGELTQVAFDLAAVAGEDIDGELRIVVGIARFTADIEAPADATEIDLFGLVGGFMGGGFGFPGDDPFPDDGLEDDVLEDDAPTDDPFGDADIDCITPEELEEVEEIMGEDAREELEQLIDLGILELC